MSEQAPAKPCPLSTGYPPKPKWKRALFNCPRCNAPITEDEYIGANYQIYPPSRFYHCKNCGEIIKKPITKKVKA